MVWNDELGKEIPEGWECRTWRDIATLEYGKGLRDYHNKAGTVPVFGTNGRVGWTTKALMDSEGIIIGRKGVYRGIHFSRTPFYVIDTAFFLSPKIPLRIKWAYYEILCFDINGMETGSAIPSTSREDFYDLCSIIPPLVLQHQFDALLTILYARKSLHDDQNTTLGVVRDVLLAKLAIATPCIPEGGKLTEDGLA